MHATSQARRAVLRAWSSRDDYNVPSIHTALALRLLAYLDAGADPVALARHARHYGPACCSLRDII